MLIGIEAAHANKEHRTGVEEYCWQIIQNLKKQIPADVQVVLYTNEKLKGELTNLPPNWQEKILPWFTKLPRRFNKGWSQVRLAWEFLSNPPDVFFAPAQLIPFVVPKNTFATIHDSAFIFQKKSYWFASRWYLRLMNWLIIKKAKVILTHSEFSKKEIEKYYGAQAVKKVVVTPISYNKDVFNLEKVSGVNFGEVAKKYGISKKYIISVNRLEEKKNTKRIVQAFNILKSTGQDIQLVLVGKPGVGYEDVKKEIDGSKYKEDIILPGWVKNADVAPLIAGAQVFVVPSLYEGFGLPVLQAMAVGCPVVASTGSSLEEVGGEAALYADPEISQDIADKINKYLESVSVRQEKIKLGLERVKQYSWERTASLTSKILF